VAFTSSGYNAAMLLALTMLDWEIILAITLLLFGKYILAGFASLNRRNRH
jgi:hypothetical protein